MRAENIAASSTKANANASQSPPQETHLADHRGLIFSRSGEFRLDASFALSPPVLSLWSSHGPTQTQPKTRASVFYLHPSGPLGWSLSVGKSEKATCRSIVWFPAGGFLTCPKSSSPPLSCLPEVVLFIKDLAPSPAQALIFSVIPVFYPPSILLTLHIHTHTSHHLHQPSSQ